MIQKHFSLRSILFAAFVLVTVLAAFVPAYLSRQALYRDHLDMAGHQALQEALFLKSLWEAGYPADAGTDKEATVEAGLNARQWDAVFAAARGQGERGARLTVTDASGRVLRDSHLEPGQVLDMDNHADRPEVGQALAEGQGSSVRYSNSLGFEAVYAAVALADGGIMRVALPLSEVRSGFKADEDSFWLIIIGAMLVCLLLAAFFTRWVRGRISEMAEAVENISLGQGSRLHQVPGSEFLPLAEAVNRMAGNIEEALALTRDQRDQLESILEGMGEGVLVLGPGGRIRRWNRALAELFPQVMRALDKPLIEGIPVPALQRRVDELLAVEGQRETYESGRAENAGGAVQIETPDGRFLLASVSGVIGVGGAGENANIAVAVGAVIVINDATELMRLERVRRDFVANVSHEMRTPLTAIAGYAETLMGLEEIGTEYRGFAAVIYRQANMLSRIINDLLSLASVENSRQNAAPASYQLMNPAEALKEAQSLCAAQAEAKRLRIATDFSQAAQVRADPSMLAQVFRNLLENSCRYSPVGGEIRVAARPLGNSREILFSVADDGPGIPAAELPRIFERFYQVKKERNSGSTGIGLAICKHIVERHGGRIWAESPSGNSATAMLFTLLT
ncbi:MAG: PAS domain-containing sensor histidine kinase [Deltaproteobacteria bacterium]|jgi:two-component system phosphate regulon sensor histidine kinase PhoR|nr:PAS domain-containing sensor histidine kinase [Deltaproteobacteria bacterium]